MKGSLRRFTEGRVIKRRE